MGIMEVLFRTSVIIFQGQLTTLMIIKEHMQQLFSTAAVYVLDHRSTICNIPQLYLSRGVARNLVSGGG